MHAFDFAVFNLLISISQLPIGIKNPKTFTCQTYKFIIKEDFVFWRGVRAGRRSTIGNRVYRKYRYRGFESLPLRKNLRSQTAGAL